MQKFTVSGLELRLTCNKRNVGVAIAKGGATASDSYGQNLHSLPQVTRNSCQQFATVVETGLPSGLQSQSKDFSKKANKSKALQGNQDHLKIHSGKGRRMWLIATLEVCRQSSECRLNSLFTHIQTLTCEGYIFAKKLCR